MDLNTLYHRTVECWADRVNAVADDEWDAPTPCAEWTVRDLVNHVAAEDLWTVPLMEGATIGEVGDRFGGDVLGERPAPAALEAAKAAVSVVAERLPYRERVHLSYGDESAEEYLRQLAADHLVHAWDLAAATGGDTRLDPHLVAEVSRWFAGAEDLMRAAGIIGDAAPPTGEPLGDLLAASGRDAAWGPNHAAMTRLVHALADRDLDRVMGIMGDGCVLELAVPAPADVPHEGAEAVRRGWQDRFEEWAEAAFWAEEWFVCRDRGVLRWQVGTPSPDGSGSPDPATGQLRGVDLLRFRSGHVTRVLSYASASRRER